MVHQTARDVLKGLTQSASVHVALPSQPTRICCFVQPVSPPDVPVVGSTCRAHLLNLGLSNELGSPPLPSVGPAEIVIAIRRSFPFAWHPGIVIACQNAKSECNPTGEGAFLLLDDSSVCTKVPMLYDAQPLKIAHLFSGSSRLESSCSVGSIAGITYPVLAFLLGYLRGSVPDGQEADSR